MHVRGGGVAPPLRFRCAPVQIPSARVRRTCRNPVRPDDPDLYRTYRNPDDSGTMTQGQGRIRGRGMMRLRDAAMIRRSAWAPFAGNLPLPEAGGFWYVFAIRDAPSPAVTPEGDIASTGSLREWDFGMSETWPKRVRQTWRQRRGCGKVRGRAAMARGKCVRSWCAATACSDGARQSRTAETGGGDTRRIRPPRPGGTIRRHPLQ